MSDRTVNSHANTR